MEPIPVRLGARSYSIHISNGILKRSGRILRDLNLSKRFIVISSARILFLHGEKLTQSFQKAGLSHETLVLPEGERFKNLSTAEKIYKQLARLRVDRKTMLIAFGGGVIGDMVGYTAATFLRGVDYVQIPTTLLAQLDSSIGGKTGVNLKAGKNLVGAFHQPRSVIIDPLVLLTLPTREFHSGLYEAIKYGVIRSRLLFNLVESKHGQLPGPDKNSLQRMIAECARIKADIVSCDERESELRMILNFGHTLGHALEAATQYKRLTHGEAIGHGMIMASRLAVELGRIEPEEALHIEGAISQISHLPPVHSLNWKQVCQPLMADKKIVDRRLQFILPLKIGQVEILQDTPIDAVKEVFKSYVGAKH